MLFSPSCQSLPHACPLSTPPCPTCLTLSPSATHLSAMQTCGSLPGMALYPPPPSLYTSAQAGGALLNRLAVSMGITSQRRGLAGTAYRQTVSPGSPVSPTFSHDPILLLSAAVHLAHDLAHTRPHSPWRVLTWIFFLTISLQILFVCMHRNLACTHKRLHTCEM